MKHFDLFSGYGGFTLALERAYANNRELLSSQTTEDLSEVLSESQGGQVRTIGFSEIDKYASAVLKYHWPNTKNYGDISKINWSEVPDFDLLTGGSPCQDLSIAGKRAGLGGQRSGLFYEFMRAVREKSPQYFIWENVKGALSSNNGRDFALVLNEMAETGYSLWWQVLNAKDFGVPQNRERIFVVGFRDECPREIFFERGDDKKHNEVVGQQTQVTGTINCCMSKGGNKQDAKSGVLALTNSRIRRLTPTECERLMGLPDGWTKRGSFGKRDADGELYFEEISDSQRYKLCGNGVVVNVVQELIEQLILPS